MWLALSLVIVVSFLLYVLCFGASSSGVIGQLHHFLTASVGGCLRRVLGKCFSKRCFACMEKVEDYCCWRPNPFLQLFYLGLMAGGFALYWMHSCPLMPNPRLPLGHKIASYFVMGGGIVVFTLASFVDPGTITASSLHRFSRVAYDGQLWRSLTLPQP